MVSANEIVTVQTVTVRIANISLKNNGLIYVETFEDSVTEIEDVEEIHKTIIKLSKENNAFLLVIPGIGSSATDEARKLAAERRKLNLIKAEAIVINSLPIRLMANFFIRFNKPVQKIKLFSNEATAADWLLKEKKKK